MPEKSILKQPVFIAGVLVLATLAVYLPAGSLGFIYFDDPSYVFENPHVSAGLTWNGILWAFTHSYVSNWHPLTWISHMLDCELYGLNPGGHHVTNLLFHCANTVILFAFLRKLTSRTWPSAFVAGLFALHPLHVESVAWISERKDVLSTFFGLLCLLSYLKYVTAKPATETPAGSPVQARASRRYAITLLLFAFALLSKPMLVTLPCVMLLLDWWPLRRVELSTPTPFSQGLWPLVREKLPFLGLSACSCFITFLAQNAGGAVAALEKLPVDARISNAIVSYVRYIGKLLWPSDLAALYPYHSWPLLTVLICTAALVGITLLALWQRTERPYIVVGWLWFLGTLVPVIGIVQVGAQSIADRYTYFPSIGLFIISAWGAADALAFYKRIQLLATAGAAAALVALALAAQPQILHWQNSETLFRYTIAVTSRNPHAYNELGLYLAATREWNDAEACYKTAIEMDPGYAHPRNNLGCALIDQGRSEEAITNCQAALQLQPSFAEAHNNLGTALANCGKTEEAIYEYQNALHLRPDYPQAHFNLANTLTRANKIDNAAKEYETAIELNPLLADAYNNYGFILLQQQKFTLAIMQFRAALAIDPGLWQARCGLGEVLVNEGHFTAAATEFAKVLEVRPDATGARTRLDQCKKALTGHQGGD